ncbi:HAD family hydrolase [Mycobacterium sp. NPDC050041]|uniref:HAD family hydrolase n=1 Tax=Mycobacterium sp. NPDC050041 TaxID=3364293 RepID=UPI003C2D6209
MATMVHVDAVLFDFSGTLFRLEEDESWFAGMVIDGRHVDRHAQSEIMRRLTQPVELAVPLTPDAHRAWTQRDLEPALHREANLHVLRASGLADHHADALYARLIDPACWTPYPDTVDVLAAMHARGVKTAVVSNIPFDIRPAFAAIGAGVDEFVLSFEVGAIKPDAAIFAEALTRLGVDAAHTVMVGDSEEADGGARALGCEFVLVEPLPTAQRPDGLRRALAEHGLPVCA